MRTKSSTQLRAAAWWNALAGCVSSAGVRSLLGLFVSCKPILSRASCNNCTVAPAGPAEAITAFAEPTAIDQRIADEIHAPSLISMRGLEASGHSPSTAQSECDLLIGKLGFPHGQPPAYRALSLAGFSHYGWTRLLGGGDYLAGRLRSFEYSDILGPAATVMEQ